MPKRNWIGATGFTLSGEDIPEEVKGKHYGVGIPFKIENEEPLLTLDIKTGDIVGMRIQNQSSSGILYANQIIIPKKRFELPAGEFNFEITKLREKPSGIFSEIVDYLNELY